jgi:hypothetical protein
MGRRVVVAWAMLLDASARPRSRAAALSVVAATALAAASPAPADDHTHLKGRGAGVVTPATVACPAGFTPLSLTGMGRASHLGRYTWASTECFNFTTLVTVDGRFTLTAANGDALTGTYSGGATVVGGIATFEDQAVVTGGTGRFAGASGNLVVRGTAVAATMTYEHRLSGTISRPDDDEDENEDDD